MNRNVQLLIGALVIIAIGAGAFAVYKNSSQAPFTLNQTLNTTVSNNKTQAKKTLKDFITSDKAQKCTFRNKDTSAGTVEGISYIANGKMRGDFNTAVGGREIVMHIIISDNTSYTWAQGQSVGYRSAFSLDSSTEPSGSQKSVDINQYVDYSCSGWTIDSSVFTPPNNIKFSETGVLTGPSGTQTGGQGTQNQCASCDYLSGDEKVQCRTALKCN